MRNDRSFENSLQKDVLRTENSWEIPIEIPKIIQTLERPPSNRLPVAARAPQGSRSTRALATESPASSINWSTEKPGTSPEFRLVTLVDLPYPSGKIWVSHLGLLYIIIPNWMEK